MTAKMDQFPAMNSNPVLSVAKDGVILYSNKAAEPLLHDWGVRVGDRLPLHLKIFVQRAISQKNIEKIEVNMGKKVYFIIFYPLPEQECVNIYGFDISERENPEGKPQESETQETANLELATIIDVKVVQSLMSDFYTLAHIPMALLDLKGNILVSVGWQEICTRFHRANPDACRHCLESDLNLTAGVAPGGYKLYKCKNNMWDVVTPITVEGQHVGNIFSGQFFLEDEPLDYELFRSQARKYGFNEEEYIAALEKVPRLSRKAVDTSMAFFMTFANMISQLSYSNIKLSKSLAERNAVVDALKESEKRERARSDELTAVLDAVPVAVYVTHDPQARKITGNRLSYEWLRVPVGTNLSKSAPEGEKPEIFKLFKDGVEIPPSKMPSQLSATGIEINDCELDIVSAGGEIRHLLGNARPLRDEQGNLRGSVSAFIDITERKKAEETIRLSNLYNRSLIEASLDPLVTIGRNGKITDLNGATEKITGYSREELIGTDISDYFTEPEEARKGYQQAFMHGEVWDYPLEIRHKDGHITPVLYNASVYRDENGKVIGVFAAARDVTERKRAEEALRESEKSFRALVTASSEMVYRVSPDWSEMRYFYGRGFLANTESPNPTWLHEYVLPEDQQRVTAIINEAVQKKTTYQTEHRVRLADGSVGWLFSRAVPILDTNGEIVEWFGAASDITERKRVEEALRESEERLRLLTDNLPDSAVYQYIHEPDGSIHFVYFSAGIERLTGIKVSDVLRDPDTLHMQTPQPYLDRLVEAEARSARELSDLDMELPMLLPDGQIRWMRLHSRPRQLSGDRIIWDGVQTDITENKKAEEAIKKAHENLEELVEERTAELEKAYNSLKESERGLAEAQKMAHIGNWSWDIITGETYWSDEMYRIFGLNPHELSPAHNEFLNHIHPHDRAYVNNSIKKAINEKPFGIDYRIITANGKERTVHAESEVTFNPNNNPIQVKGIIQDITERKEAEETLANIETARKKEIHHRIKNNLQVISSLLDLQADKFDNLRVIEAFRESQNRVISMALIHEELYKGEGTETLDFSTYIKELAENLFQTYRLSSKNIHLNMDLEENAFFDMDTAVPLGIIVNELISNSLKHAFPGRDEGEIRIKLSREENEECIKSITDKCKSTNFILTVSDDGVGIPENLDIENLDSLGFQLVTSLVDQLDGEFQLKRNKGTEFTMRFAVTVKDNLAQVNLKSQER